jgi:hypothetical protein
MLVADNGRVGLESIPLLNLLLKLISDIDAREDRRAQHVEGTLRGIIEAASETLKYEAWRDENGGRRDKSREIDLSARWYMAAVPLRAYDRDLADRLGKKGAYWLNPKKWTPLEISDARIGLVAVREETDRLLSNRIRDRR